jgi:AcrR family transcriptional regulator
MEHMTITLGPVGTEKPKEVARRRGNKSTRIPEILEVAINVFASQGNIGFTQRLVASEAGIRLSTLQHYFASRESLLQATIEEMARRILDRYRVLANDVTRSPEASLEAILDVTFAELTDPSNVVTPFALECWNLAEHQSGVRDLMVKVSGEFQGLFSGLVSQINQSLSPQECRLRGALIYSHWEGLIVFLRRSGSNKPDPAAFQQATKIVWKALSNAS